MKMMTKKRENKSHQKTKRDQEADRDGVHRERGRKKLETEGKVIVFPSFFFLLFNVANHRSLLALPASFSADYPVVFCRRKKNFFTATPLTATTPRSYGPVVISRMARLATRENTFKNVFANSSSSQKENKPAFSVPVANLVRHAFEAFVTSRYRCRNGFSCGHVEHKCTCLLCKSCWLAAVLTRASGGSFSSPHVLFFSGCRMELFSAPRERSGGFFHQLHKGTQDIYICIPLHFVLFHLSELYFFVLGFTNTSEAICVSEQTPVSVSVFSHGLSPFVRSVVFSLIIASLVGVLCVLVFFRSVNGQDVPL